MMTDNVKSLPPVVRAALTATAIEAVQKLEARIAELEAENEQLRERLSVLTAPALKVSITMPPPNPCPHTHVRFTANGMFCSICGELLAHKTGSGVTNYTIFMGQYEDESTMDDLPEDESGEG